MKNSICYISNSWKYLLLRVTKLFAIVVITIAVVIPVLSAQNKKSVKVGFVIFLSGAAAGPFGVPARNAAELMVEAINKGLIPQPYNKKGLAGVQIAPIYVDENSKQKVTDYKKLVQKDAVDLVIGYTSSGSCKAIAPVVESSKRLTVFFDCGTPQIFEDIVTKPKYLFRATAHAAMDSVGAARYLIATGANASTIAGINQNYAWGQDSWRDFLASMEVLAPGVKVVDKQFPRIFAGQYGSEITSLLIKKPKIIHSSFWGGDMEALILQGSARGIFKRSKVVLTTGESALDRLSTQIPNGTIIGARGLHGILAPKNALNTWFRKAYFDRFGSWPTYPSYHMVQSILAVKAAADKAGSTEQNAIIAALKGSKFETPSGSVSMAISNGHQAIQDTAYGTYKYDKKTRKPTLKKIQQFKAECVNPPAGVKSADWVKSKFQGAKCK